MRTLVTTLCCLFSLLGSFAQETVVAAVTADTIPTEEYTDEELALIREKHIEELLPNTRALVFIDSLVVDKDAFLSQLRLTDEVGHYALSDAVITSDHPDVETGQTAFINSLQNTAFLSIADSLGILRLNALFRNGGQWTDPQPIAELHSFTYQDYPFLCTDGSTLYFSANGTESIGGLDLFVTRYNEETRQFVRPQNLGFPYNSPANDYLLAIDETLGIGVLVSDRRQPDDKVCIYWFIDEEQRNIYDYDPDDEEAKAIVRDFAAIARIADTQVDYEEALQSIRMQWKATLEEQSRESSCRYCFIIDNNTTYTSLDEFKNTQARALAEQWIGAQTELLELESRQQQTRNAYAATHDKVLIPTLQELEKQLPQKRSHVHALEKQFRAAERQ